MESFISIPERNTMAKGIMDMIMDVVSLKWIGDKND